MSTPLIESRVIGRCVPQRPELWRFVSGRGCYVDDVDLPHMLHAVVLRSPHAHARILEVDVADARAHPGVAAVFTGADLIDKMKPIPVRLNPYNTLDAFLQYPLAGERVRYVGEPVALIIATSRYVAEDALELIDVDYDPLPAVTNAESDDVPVALYESTPDNVASHIRDGFGDVDGALAEADEVVDMRFRTGRHSAIPMETRGLVARFDGGHKRMEVWGPTKVVHFNRTVLATMLEMPEHKIHFVEPDVGGGFGARGEFYPEDFLVPFAAMQLRRPIKWIEDRMEHLIAINHSRQQTYDMKLGLARDGTLLGLQVDLVNDMGGYLRTHGVIVPEMSAGFFPGPYRWGAYRCHARCVMTNKTPTGTYRCPGRYESNAARERLLDVAAARLDMDPVTLRRKNMITPDAMPYRVGTRALGEDVVYDSGDYPAALDEVLRIAKYDERRRDAATSNGQRVGYGIACFTEKTGKGPFEGARVAIDPSGGVEVHTGASSLGQGLETGMSQIVAEALGVTPDVVTVRHGDTDLLPFGVGSFASRTTVMAGNAAYQAAHAVRTQVFDLAAQVLDVAIDALTMDEGQVQASDGSRLSLAQIAAYSGPRNGAPVLESTQYFECNHMAYSHGAVVAEVTVDTAIGRVTPRHIWIVYDVGTVINPQLVAGQIEGGAAQAVGGALLEEFLYDDYGQFLTGSFMDYLMPTADAVPPIDHLNLDRSPSPLNPLGVKGAGEAGVAGVGGALANAVADALGQDVGAHVDRLPMTPERVWRWIGTSTPDTASATARC